MRLLLDENLSHRLADRLASRFPGTRHVADSGLQGRSDWDIWNYAGSEGYVVLSKDNDFRQLAFLLGPPPQVIWLRLRNASTATVETLVLGAAERIESFANEPGAALLVIEA